MNIKDKIEKQLDAGFTPDEIRANLRADGFTDESIKRELGSIPQNADAGKRAGPWRVIWISVSGVFAIIRLARLFQRDSTLGMIALLVIVGVMIAVYAVVSRRK